MAESALAECRKIEEASNAQDVELAGRAFEEIVNVYKERVARLVRIVSRYNDPDDVKDITQDTFFELWLTFRKGAYTPDTQRPLISFLRVLAIRANAKHWKRLRSHRQKQESLRFSLPPHTEQAPDTVTASEALSERHHLNAALKRLKQSDRDVIALKLEELPWEEIAHILGCSSNAARQRHHKAIARLQRDYNKKRLPRTSTRGDARCRTTAKSPVSQ